MDQTMELLNEEDFNYVTNLIGKTVNVSTVDDKSYVGTVYVIDPQTKIVVLINGNNGLCLILPHAINNVEIVEDFEDKTVENCSITIDDFQSQQNFVKKIHAKLWLEKNFVRVKEDGVLLNVDDQLFIEPPYGPEQCISKNESILERTKDILARKPY